MKRITLVPVVFAVLVAVAGQAGAEEPRFRAVIAFHARAHTLKGWDPCGESPAAQGIDCVDYETWWPLLTSADVYIVAVNTLPDSGVGISGLSLSLEYQEPAPGRGVDVFRWVLCAASEVTSDGPNGPWPEAGSGNRIQWDAETNCQDTVLGGHIHAVAGAFYVYAYGEDLIFSGRNPGEAYPSAVVFDCEGAAHPYEPGFSPGGVAFNDSGAGGVNACTWIGDPVERATWGRLKTLYRD